MASWYRTGTVSVANGGTAVTGVGTAWLGQVSPGDLITFDGGQSFQEVGAVTSNTALALATPHAGTAISGGAYAVVRNFTSTLPAQIAATTADLLSRWGDFRDVALTGIPTAPTPADEVTTQQVPTAGWVMATLRRYGLGGGPGTSTAVTTLWPSNNADDVNRTGVYTTNATSNVPFATSVLLHMERNFAAGISALQLTIVSSGALHYRSATTASGVRTWGAWAALTTADTALSFRPNLGAGIDLNAVVTQGAYLQGSSTNASSGTNYPVANSGWLLVYSTGSGATTAVQQVYHALNSNRVFTRSLVVGAWSAWRELSTPATNAETLAGTDASKAVTPAGLRSVLTGPLHGLRNLLINPTFGINQRGYTSGTATTTANQYTLDRWRVVVSGQSVTLSGETLTAPAGGVEQVIEGANIGTGTHVLSWYGTATATVNGAAVAKGGTVNLTTGTNATVRFSAGTVSKPQLEPGALPTAFDRRPIALELTLCQRYAEVINTSYLWDHALTASFSTGFSFGFHVRKRASPTVTPIAIALSGWTYSSVSGRVEGITVRLTPDAAGPAARSGGIIFFADAEL